MKAFISGALFGVVVRASQPVCYGTLHVTETVYQTEWKLADGTVSTAVPQAKGPGYTKGLAYPSIATGDLTQSIYKPNKGNSPTKGDEDGKHETKTYVQNGKLIDTWEQLDPHYDGWLHGEKLWKCIESSKSQESWTKAQTKGVKPTLSRGGHAYPHVSSALGSPVPTKRYGEHDDDETTPRPYSHYATSSKAQTGAYPTFSWSNYTTTSVAASSSSVASEPLSSSSTSASASSGTSTSIVSSSSEPGSISSTTSSATFSSSSSETSAPPSSSSDIISSSSTASSSTLSSIESSVTSSESSTISSSSIVSSSSSSAVPPAPAVTSCPVGERFYIFSTRTEQYLAAEPATGVDFTVRANQPIAESASQFTFVFDEGVQRCRLHVTGGFEVVILTSFQGPTATSGIYYWFADDFSSASTSTRSRLTCQAVSPEGGQALRVRCVVDQNSAFTFLGDDEGYVGSQTNIPQWETTLLLEAAP